MNAKPWHIMNKKKRVLDNISKERMDICKTCIHLIKTTKQCKKCGCFMNIKTKIDNAYCPIGKW